MSFNKTAVVKKIDRTASSGSQEKQTYVFHFSWPPLQEGL